MSAARELIELLAPFSGHEFVYSAREREDNLHYLTAQEAAFLKPDTPAFRRAEFSTGRACAHSALEALGCTALDVSIGNAGEPLWPSGFVGSISHSQNLCVAAAARAERLSLLGIDLQYRSHSHSNLLSKICLPTEREWLHSQDLDSGLGATLFFSAKEAFYKAQYPVTGITNLWFHDVSVEFDLERRLFRIRPLCSLPELGVEPPYFGEVRWTSQLVFSTFGMPDRGSIRASHRSQGC